MEFFGLHSTVEWKEAGKKQGDRERDKVATQRRSRDQCLWPSWRVQGRGRGGSLGLAVQSKCWRAHMEKVEWMAWIPACYCVHRASATTKNTVLRECSFSVSESQIWSRQRFSIHLLMVRGVFMEMYQSTWIFFLKIKVLNYQVWQIRWMYHSLSTSYGWDVWFSLESSVLREPLFQWHLLVLGFKVTVAESDADRTNETRGSVWHPLFLLS